MAEDRDPLDLHATASNLESVYTRREGVWKEYVTIPRSLAEYIYHEILGADAHDHRCELCGGVYAEGSEKASGSDRVPFFSHKPDCPYLVLGKALGVE